MAAPPEIVDLGEGSSRSNSPESDAIDIEDVDFEPSSNAAKSSSNSAQQQQLTSPRGGAGSSNRMAGLASPSRRSGAASSATNAKRRMKNQGSEGATNAMSRQIGPEDYEDFGATAGSFQEAGPGRSTAAAYDRLLDLDYPRSASERLGILANANVRHQTMEIHSLVTMLP